MQVRVRLLGRFRDRLPAEQKGRGVVEVGPQATIHDLLLHFGLERYPLMFAINDQHLVSESSPLAEDDLITIFEMSAGG